MAAAFVSSIVIHILNEGKGKTRGDHQVDVVVRDRYVIILVGYTHTKGNRIKRYPIPCGIEKNKKALGEEEKEEEAPGKRHATGSGENRNTLTHFDRQHRGKAEREKGQSQNGSNVQRDLHCLT